MILPNTLGATNPRFNPEGIGRVMVVPVVYWQLVVIPRVTWAVLPLVLAR